MTRTILAIALAIAVFMASRAWAQTTARLAVDMPQTDTVTSFELAIGTGAFASVGLPPVTNLPDTPAGFNTYIVYTIPSGTTGVTYRVRACNANAIPVAGCGPDGSISTTGIPSAPRVRILPAAAGAQELVVRPPGGGW